MRAAIYVHGPNANQNLTRLRQYARESGFEITAEFIDQEIGGPALDEVIEHAHRQAHDAIVIWDDREQSPRHYPNPHAAA